MTSIFQGQPSKGKAKIPIKTRVIWVPGIYISPDCISNAKGSLMSFLGPQKMISSTSPSTVGDASQSLDEFLFRGKSACKPSRYKWSYNSCKWPKINR